MIRSIISTLRIRTMITWGQLLMDNKVLTWNNSKLKYFVAPFLLIISLLYSYNVSNESNFIDRFVLILEHIAKFAAPFSLMAIGASLVISTGGVDLSSSGVVTLSTIITAICYKLSGNLVLSLSIGMFIGISSGALLGFFVTKLSSPPLIITWAWGAILITLSILFSSGMIIDFPNPNSQTISTQAIEYSPTMIYWGSIFIVVYTMYIIYTGIPRRACAVGANRTAATYAGIRVNRAVFWTYVISGISSGLGGLLWFMLSGGQGSTTTFVGYELIPIAISLIGGTVLTGGYLNLFSVIVASLFWANLELIIGNIDTSNSIPDWQQKQLNLVFGVIIILISTILGKKLSGETITIHTEQKIK